MASPLLQFAVLCVVVQQLAATDSVQACPSDAAVEQNKMHAHMALLQTSSRFRNKDMGSVLFMVKSYSGFYDTKLRAQMQTWGSLLPRSSFLVLGDKAWSEFPIEQATECGADATEGLACRVAYGMTVAAKTPGNWSWLYVIDDDHYVRPGLVEKNLAEFNESEPVAGGCYGCGRPQYCGGKGGFCGGCGYFFSRVAVKAMVGDDATEFMAYHSRISKSNRSEGREDMAISCTLFERVPNVEIKTMEHMAGDGPILEKLQPAQDKAMSWHHIGPEMMHALHQIVVKSA